MAKSSVPEGRSLGQLPPLSPEPGVSVVIPALNEERYIGALLTSLAAQTYPADRIEVIVAGVLALAFLAIAIARWAYKSSDLRTARRNTKLAASTPEQFAVIAERNLGPTITETLRQRSEHDKDE